MSELTLSDYHWLICDEAKPWLAEAAGDPNSTKFAKLLNRNLSEVRAFLVQELARLRQKGTGKFQRAAEMFFSHLGLQQATDETIARYKASRFVGHTPVADLCCGIGGDLMALAKIGEVTGLDYDPSIAVLAAANCELLGLENAEVACANVQEIDLGDYESWHIDPDRRPEGNRSIHIENHEPNREVIEELLEVNPSGAIKLAPATELPNEWLEASELEWIGNRRECKQLVAWRGELTTRAGERCVTVPDDENGWRTFHGEAEVPLELADSVGGYLYDPHAALIAARLTGALASAQHLLGITPRGGYLTGDAAIDDPLLARFKVIESLPLDLKKLKAALRARGISKLEIKKRGVDHDPEKLRKQLLVPGDNSATLLLGRLGQRGIAVLAQRE